MAFGYSARVEDIGGIAIGSGANTTSSRQCVLGGSSSLNEIRTLVIGRNGSGGGAQSPPNVTIKTSDAVSTNNAGGDSTLQAGRSTGDQDGGDLILEVADAGSSGSSLNDAHEALRINATDGLVKIHNDLVVAGNSLGSATSGGTGTIYAPDGADGAPGTNGNTLALRGGNSNDTDAGDITLEPGQASGTGDDGEIQIGTATSQLIGLYVSYRTDITMNLPPCQHKVALEFE